MTSSLTMTGRSTEKLDVIIEGRKQTVKSILAKTDGVTAVDERGELEKGCFEYIIDSKRDVRRLIFRALAKTDFSILSMKPVERSLEDTYLNIITGKYESEGDADNDSNI